MKPTTVIITLTTVLITAAFAGGSGGGQPPQVGYLNTTANTIVSFSVQENPCLPSKMPFDFEPVNGDATFDLDLVWGKTYYSVLMLYSGNQRYNNGNGDFPNDDGTFFNSTGSCVADASINGMVFGWLRPGNQRRDLAMLRQNEIRIYQNTGNGVATSASQIISQGAFDGAWAPFLLGDNYEDLVVYDGSQVRAYRNMNDGTVNTTPVTFSITATKVFFAQMDESIYPVNQTTRFDLVSYSGSQVTLRLNNNSNGFSSTQTFDVGFNITGLAIGDLDNDGFNDIVVGGYNIAKVFHNNSGTINTTATWSATNFYFNVVPLIGDMGTPTTADKNDGWNDIVITGYEAPVRIFANNQGTFGSTPDQSFQSGSPYAPIGKVLLADIQNKGGLSLVYQQSTNPIGNPSNLSIRINKHTGDPAPAPPLNVQAVVVPREYGYADARISWRRNIERDIASYKLYRRITGICGDGQWYYIATLLSSQTEYIDQLSTAGSGDCLAQYKLVAIDAANTVSDYSAIVQIPFSSSMWKGNAGGRNTPKEYALHSAYPNPFNPSTQIKFDLPEDGFVTLNVFDVLGRKLGEVANGNYAAGSHSSTWNATNLSSGVYFARFTATDANGMVQFSKTSKLVLMK